VLVSSSHLKKETDPVSETLCLQVIRIPDDRKSLNFRFTHKLLDAFGRELIIISTDQ
jgi:hypothetical protein